MSDHDQLCPCYSNPLPDFCECNPIAKARVDERARVLTEKGIEAAVQQERHRAEIEATRADEREKIYQAIKADADARARAGRYGAGDLVAGLRVAQVIARSGGRDE